MIDAHVQLYSKLTRVEAYLLWAKLLDSGMPIAGPVNEVSGSELGEACRDLSHAEVILVIADRYEPVWCVIMDKLLEKPTYMCARGETGVPLVDYSGREIPIPMGHRRGEPLGTGGLSRRSTTKMQREYRRDPRVITKVAPNPKTMNTDSYQRYELYKVGCTVDDFIRLGGRRSDVSYDAKKGFIVLELP